MIHLVKCAGLAGLALVSAAPGVQAQGDSYAEKIREELIVTATRLPMPAKAIGTSVTILNAEDIQNRGVQLGSDLLREVPGVAINRAGPVGAITQARIRGAEGNHTLVLIDGIEANNPGLGFEFNFADLLTYNIDRVEVLRGPQSAMYGSEAIGGVVSISTHVPKEEGGSVSAEVQGGSYGTSQIGVSAAGRSTRGYANVSAMRYSTDGISASAIEPERDGYETTTLHGKLRYALTERIDLSAVIRHADNEADFDSQDFDFPATPTQGLVIDSNQSTESSQLYALLGLSASAYEDKLQTVLRYSYVDTESEGFQDGIFDSGNEGERKKLELQSSLAFGPSARGQTITLGVQRETLDFRNRFPSFPGANYTADDEQNSFVAEYSLSTELGLGFNASVRHDDNDRFDNATTYRVAGSYLFAERGTRLHAAVGEGITNPSFFELFGFSPSSFSGNPNLSPEQSSSWEFGVEQTVLEGRALLDLTYFDATLEDEITTVFDSTTFLSTAENLNGKSERRGVEFTLQAEFSEAWQARATYTYLDAKEPNGDIEVRRPQDTASLNINYRFVSGRGNLNVGVIYNGEQEDSEFIFSTPATRVSLEAFTLLNVGANFDITERVQVFVRGDNLLDEDYNELFGFRSPGRAGSVGVRARL